MGWNKKYSIHRVNRSTNTFLKEHQINNKNLILKILNYLNRYYKTAKKEKNRKKSIWIFFLLWFELTVFLLISGRKSCKSLLFARNFEEFPKSWSVKTSKKFDTFNAKGCTTALHAQQILCTYICILKTPKQTVAVTLP